MQTSTKRLSGLPGPLSIQLHTNRTPTREFALVPFGASRFSESLVAEELVFFFQAEDGIRDIGVTGVQTCALPIYVTPRTRAKSHLAWIPPPVGLPTAPAMSSPSAAAMVARYSTVV